MIRTTIDGATEQLRELAQAVKRGEEVFITTEDDGEPVVLQLIVASEEHPWGTPQAGSAKGWFILTDAFDEPLEDFEEYMR